MPPFSLHSVLGEEGCVVVRFYKLLFLIRTVRKHKILNFENFREVVDFSHIF